MGSDTQDERAHVLWSRSEFDVGYIRKVRCEAIWNFLRRLPNGILKLELDDRSKEVSERIWFGSRNMRGLHAAIASRPESLKLVSSTQLGHGETTMQLLRVPCRSQPKLNSVRTYGGERLRKREGSRLRELYGYCVNYSIITENRVIVVASVGPGRYARDVLNEPARRPMLRLDVSMEADGVQQASRRCSRESEDGHWRIRAQRSETLRRPAGTRRKSAVIATR